MGLMFFAEKHQHTVFKAVIALNKFQAM